MCTVHVASSGLFYNLNAWFNEEKEHSYHVKQTTNIEGKIVLLCDVIDPPYKAKKKIFNARQR